MNRVEEAKAIFRSGFNCSQAVLSSLSEDIGIDKELALKIASGFGAGMGRLQNTCGAVAGAFMVISYLNGQYRIDDKESSEKTYQLIRNFAKDFEEINGSINCLSLMDCDLQTENGIKTAIENNYFETKCVKYVEDAVKLIQSKYLK